MTLCRLYQQHGATDFLLLYKTVDLLDHGAATASLSFARTGGLSLMSVRWSWASGPGASVRIYPARVADPAGAPPSPLWAPAGGVGVAPKRRKIFAGSRNDGAEPALFGRRRPTPPAQAPPQQGPDRKIRPTCYAPLRSHKPMKWLANPPCLAQAWSIQPGRSSVFGATGWPSCKASP